MQNKYNSVKPFFLILICTLILFGISAIPNDVFVFGIKLKKPNLFSDLKEKPNTLKPVFASKIPTLTSKKESVTSIIINADSLSIIDFSVDTINNMQSFYKALSELKKSRKKVRIAYFGDSMIEGDLLTMDLRTLFQNHFGGNGVGLVPITSITAGFRTTIISKFSDNWVVNSLIETKKKKQDLGILGYTYFANADSTNSATQNAFTNYKAVGKRHLNNFENAYLFYGKNDEKSNYTFNNENKKLAADNIVNIDTIFKNQKNKSFNLKFNVAENLPLYAVSMESDSGVVLDNISFRGNSGLPLSKIGKEVYEGFNKYLNYDLIILHYGLNVVSEKSTDYYWYKAGMTRTVNYLKKCFPNTAFLIVSVNDKSYKNPETDDFVTMPGVPVLVNMQKEIAKNCNTSFWNLYENMGGYNSMVKWVTADTTLANKDYTHLNFRGANKVANMLYKAIDTDYKLWQQKQKNTETNSTISIK